MDFFNLRGSRLNPAKKMLPPWQTTESGLRITRGQISIRVIEPST